MLSDNKFNTITNYEIAGFVPNYIHIKMRLILLKNHTVSKFDDLVKSQNCDGKEKSSNSRRAKPEE